jgi:threonine dehydrogenase-like Zn-dependent dehydrogenase
MEKSYRPKIMIGCQVTVCDIDPQRLEVARQVGQGREITIQQPSHFEQDDLDHLCRLVGRARVHLLPLLRDIVPVTEAPRLYDRLRDAPSTLLGTVFDWQTT